MATEEDIGVPIAGLIRSRSHAGLLIRFDEILDELKSEDLAQAAGDEPDRHAQTALEAAMRENADLREVLNRQGVAYYYSLEGMTPAYAGILVNKTEGPLRMIAEAVRENSRIYPRPVPLLSFTAAPFDLSPEAIVESVRALGLEEEFQDIGQTATSAGAIYLYSTRHLARDHAEALAEWLDVGQADNP